MSCIASSFVGSVAALKATKVQVSVDFLPPRNVPAFGSDVDVTGDDVSGFSEEKQVIPFFRVELRVFARRRHTCARLPRIMGSP